MFLFLYISLALYGVFTIWSCAVASLIVDAIMRHDFGPRALWLRRTLKWPALLGVITFTTGGMLLNHTFFGLDFWTGLLFLAFWWRFRNYGDDEPPKTDRKRVRARIKQIGGRLVVVPEAA